ncbi:alpha/beta fold hydrolase [candidate division KSB1 bacterium]|nr:alpha/beta fold hydrolase [candidate division KSB1 bacterium]
MKNSKRYPLILAHGIFRPDYLVDSLFRKLNLSWSEFSHLGDRFHYFKGIASFLKQHGFEVYNTSVSFAAEVETRAEDLRRELSKILATTGHEKVHIIGHSMGGLDARHMILMEDMAAKVATLTTIGTPHLGASLADRSLQNGFGKIIDSLRKVINLDGIKSLTTAACSAFNNSARDAEATNAVFYQIYYSSQKRELTFLPFQKTWQIIYEKEGDNDGLVSVVSQKWEERLKGKNGACKTIVQKEFPVPADHVNQMGWWHLNREPEWWNWGVFKEKKEYEMTIKQIYLQIAREVQEHVAAA